MNAKPTFLTAAVAFTLVAGCIPEKRIVWSPDGQRAAVATPNGLFLIDADGKLLKPRLTGSATRCAWFPDGRRLAVVHKVKARQWSDVADMFNPEQTTRIEDVAKDLQRRALAYEGDWDKFEADPEEEIPSAIEIAAFLYLRDHLAEGLPEKLGKKWEEFKELQPDVSHLQIFTITDEALKPGKILIRTFHDIHRPGIDPNGRNVTLLMPPADQSNDAPALHVIPAIGGAARVVAPRVALGYDWSPDGRSLAYFRTSVPDDESADPVHLGSLATIRVADKEGDLLKEWEERNDRVGLLFSGQLTVRWLSDDRLLFSSGEVSLPTTSHDMPQRWSLFVLDPRMPASVHRVLGRDFAEPLDASNPLFVLSPDEKRVVLPGPKGLPILHTFATGETQTLVEKEDHQSEFDALPSWRSAAEIYFVTSLPVKEGSDDRTNEVVVWKDGKTKTISGDWPEDMRKGWLTGD